MPPKVRNPLEQAKREVHVCSNRLMVRFAPRVLVLRWGSGLDKPGHTGKRVRETAGHSRCQQSGLCQRQTA